MTEQPKVTAKASRIKFELSQIFPLTDPLSVLLLRLMMATNDVRHLQKLLIVTREMVDEANETERIILNGELAHLFRLLCGHLYEAGQAFRALEEKCPGRLDIAVAGDEPAKKALEYVRQAYDPNEKVGVKYSFLYPVRQFVGFHYKDEKLRETLEKHVKGGSVEGSLILTEHAGLGRYTVADHLATLLIADELSGDFEEFRQKFTDRIGEVINLAGDLGEAVDHLLAHLFDRHPSAILEEHEDIVTVPPLVQRARENVERERRSRGLA